MWYLILMNKYKDRLASFRKELQNQNLDGFIVPRADEYQGEYVAPYAERLSYLTGFTGSAGIAAILRHKAFIVSDGRYRIQLAQEVDQTLFDTADITEKTAADWLSEHSENGQLIGYDPFLHTPAQIKALEEKGLSLCAIKQNPVDMIWKDQPSRPKSPCALFPEAIAGNTSMEKRQEIVKELKKKNINAAIITLPDSLCWLLNVRGTDVAHLPVLLSYAIIHTKDASIDWFIDESRVSVTLDTDIRLCAPDKLKEHIESLKGPVLLDSNTAPIWFQQTLKKADIETVDERDPCLLPKACKTEAEQNAMHNAHIRDGVALKKFLNWIKKEGLNGTLTELDVVRELEKFRKESPEYKDSSFETISGWNENGAIVHYAVSEKTNKTISPPGLLLVDSGAQYPDGTTDVTRTIAIGTPTQEMKENYTHVLKGHIALSHAQFPKGTTGAQLDTLARRPLWDAGLDYAHGTGHGVGCYLSVHEGPAAISPRNHEPLRPGMILSNEPGYYKEGAYGIRIENLIRVIETGKKTPEGKDIYAFETLTMAPMDEDLIVEDRLSEKEKEWLDAYHRKVDEVQTL